MNRINLFYIAKQTEGLIVIYIQNSNLHFVHTYKKNPEEYNSPDITIPNV